MLCPAVPRRRSLALTLSPIALVVLSLSACDDSRTGFSQPDGRTPLSDRPYTPTADVDDLPASDDDTPDLPPAADVEPGPEVTPEPSADAGVDDDPWPNDAQLTAVGGARQVFASWTPANNSPTAYRVYLDDTQAAEVDATGALEVVVDDLVPSTRYAVRVEAGFADGTWTTTGPTSEATTDTEFDPGFQRLTQTQYNNTVADLHAAIWSSRCERTNCGNPQTFDDWMSRFTDQGWGYWGSYRNSYPADAHVAEARDPRGGFRRHDQVVYGEHVAVWLGSAMEIGGGLYRDWIGDNVIFDPCFDDNQNGVTNFDNDADIYRNCMADFVTDFGKLAFRRPLTVDEHTSFMDVYDATGATYPELTSDGAIASRGLGNVIVVIQSSPEFLYRVELGDDDGNLTAWELASRLSYHFWNTMPDAALFDAAEDGSLLTDEGYATQVTRLVADDRAKPVMEEFYEDFFRVQDIANVDEQSGPGVYNPGPNYNQTGGRNTTILPSMQMELRNLGVWFTRTTPGTYEDMFRSNLNFLECHRQPWQPEQCGGAGPYATFTYQLPGTCTADDCSMTSGWDGESPPLTFPEPERAGLVTRMGVLAHDTRTARPIRRGLWIRETLLCEHIPPPESCDVVRPPDINEDQTVRETVEAITEVEGTSCADCHSTLINGFGHALNHFTSKGVYWEQERMLREYAPDAYVLRDESEWRDINAVGTTYFNGAQVTVDGAHELADVLANSGVMERCWSRQYFRFAMGRIEWASDEATIDDLADTLRAGGTLADAYGALAHTAPFRTLDKAAPAPAEAP